MTHTNETDCNVNYSLQRIENYHSDIKDNVDTVAAHISHLFLEYLQCIRTNLQLNNQNLMTFIMLRGLYTLSNVFNLLLLYTRNIPVTVYHCQKAFYYYVEFVGQISEDEKQFLQLTSRDAASYVYKKTVFDVPSNLKTPEDELSADTKNKLHRIHTHLLLYKLILSHVLCDNAGDIKTVEKVFKQMHQIEDIQPLYRLVEKLVVAIKDANLLYNTLLAIAKKAKKHPEIVQSIHNKLASEQFSDKDDKFIRWLMN